MSTIDRPTNRAHGMRLVIVDGDQYKSMIASRMNRPNGRGSWMVYEGCDREYADQVTSEHRVRETKGSQEIEVWRPKTTTAANHYLDAEVYAAAAADLMQVRYLEETSDDPGPTAEEAAPRAGWIGQQQKWL